MKNNLWTAYEFLFKSNTQISAKCHKNILPFHHMKYSGFSFSIRGQCVRTARDLRQLLAQSFHPCVSKYYLAEVTLADERQHPESSCSPEGAPLPGVASSEQPRSYFHINSVYQHCWDIAQLWSDTVQS